MESTNDNQKKKRKRRNPYYEDLERQLNRQAGDIRCATMNWLKDHPGAWPELYKALVRETEDGKRKR